MPRNTTISSLHARELKSDVDWDPLHHMIRMQVSYKRAVRFLTLFLTSTRAIVLFTCNLFLHHSLPIEKVSIDLDFNVEGPQF